MPTKLERAEILHTAEEKENLRRKLAESSESISNYYRRLDGLPPMERGTYPRSAEKTKKALE